MKIGIDLGGSHIGIGLIDDEKNIIEKFEKDFSEDEKKNILSVVEDYIVEIVNNLKSKYEVESVGIAIPGAVKDGVIIRTVNLGIENCDISKDLRIKIDLNGPIEMVWMYYMK